MNVLIWKRGKDAPSCRRPKKTTCHDMTQADAERGSAGDAARSFSDGLAPPPESPLRRRNIDFAAHSPMPPLSSEPPRHRRRVTVDEREDQDSYGW